MLLLIVTLAAAPAALPPCERTRITPTASIDKPTIRPLGSMPPARQILGVLHVEDGCPKPIVVREDVGTPVRP